jgi:hypothetical protein
VSAEALDPLGVVLARFDWRSTESFVGYSELLPQAIRHLVSASSQEQAERLSEEIQGVVLSDGCLSEACLPVARCLVVGLEVASPEARASVLDLLAQIGSGFVYGPEREHVGRIDIPQIQDVVSLGFADYCRILVGDFPYVERVSCIDLVTMCALVNPSVRDEAAVALLEVKASPVLGPARGLIDASLQELGL